MKPSAFEYVRPDTVDEALALLAEHGEDARVLAGGQSLVPLMNLRMAAPGVLVDLNRVRDLAYIRDEGAWLALGAMTRYVDVEESELVRERLPILPAATVEVGYVGIRSRGTVGGAIAHADPVAEWPCLALALDAEIVVAGPAGRRSISADDFFLGMYETALEPGELLVELRFPLRRGRGGWGFREFSRKTGDYAVVSVAVDLADAHARVALSNLGDRPVRARALEDAIASRGGDDALLAAVPELLEREHPRAAGADYKHDLAATLTVRALGDALGRLQGGTDE